VQHCTFPETGEQPLCNQSNMRYTRRTFFLTPLEQRPLSLLAASQHADAVNAPMEKCN